jgi:aminomethyltransferase
MAVGTPFHSRTSPLCTSRSWRQWSGYFAASAYDDFFEPEYHAIRNGAGLIDVSPLFKYEIRGKDAEKLVNRVITRNAAKAKVGQVVYTPWCDRDGKVIQDGTFQRLDETTFRATAADPSLRWFELNSDGLNVEIEDLSEKLAALALQGPRSRDILMEVSSADLSGLKYFWITPTDLGDIPTLVSRTGFTGDLGYEVWVAREHAERVWDSLMEAGKGRGIVPSGMLALDLTRIEAGYPLIEVDYISVEHALIESQKSSPYEIGLGWAVNLKKPGYFIGREALAEEGKRGPAHAFVGLEVEWGELERLYAEVELIPQLSNIASRDPVPVYVGEQQIGRATSSCWSKLLKKFIALATIKAEHRQPGTKVELEMTIEYARKRAAAKVVPLPFFDPDRKRSVVERR